LLSRRSFLGAALTAAPAAGMLSSAVLPAAARAQAATTPIATTALRGLTLLSGAGCNVVALRGETGALMVDGGLAARADALLRSVLEATDSDQIDTLVNTHWHPEVTGANEAVGRAGGTIFAHEKTRMYLSNPVYSALFDGRLEPLPAIGRPNEVTRGDGQLEFPGTRVDYGYLPAAHTDGDLYVYFPEFDVLATGGVVSGDRFPLLDYRNGAWFGGRVRALQWLAELVNPDTQVVPGNGPVVDGTEIRRQRDIYLELFETLISYMNRGFGPEDAAAADPLASFADEFGDSSEFIYGAYRSMLIAYVPD
jgi:glyoxylase-like metal-dependent hydrolase (beta-lactamase superfamily II)